MHDATEPRVPFQVYAFTQKRFYVDKKEISYTAPKKDFQTDCAVAWCSGVISFLWFHRLALFLSFIQYYLSEYYLVLSLSKYYHLYLPRYYHLYLSKYYHLLHLPLLPLLTGSWYQTFGAFLGWFLICMLSPPLCNGLLCKGGPSVAERGLNI